MYLWGCAPAVLALAFSLGGCGKREKTPPLARNQSGPAIGQLAPDIDGEDLEGKRFRLSDYRGQVVVLTFWGDW